MSPVRESVHLTVQRSCPFRWLRMVSGGGGADLTTVPSMSGLVAARYLLTVFLLKPNSLAVPRTDTPLFLASWTAFHQAR